MISATSSTNPKIFIETLGGHRINWRFPVDTPFIYFTPHLMFITNIVKDIYSRLRNKGGNSIEVHSMFWSFWSSWIFYDRNYQNPLQFILSFSEWLRIKSYFFSIRIFNEFRGAHQCSSSQNVCKMTSFTPSL